MLQRFCDGWGAAAFCLLLACYHCLQSNVARALRKIKALQHLSKIMENPKKQKKLKI